MRLSSNLSSLILLIKDLDPFLLALSSLDVLESIKIGFEATKHYGTNLKNFLTHHDYDFMKNHPALYQSGESELKGKMGKRDSSYLNNM